MAITTYEYYFIISDGMYSGSVKEATLLDAERYERLLSHGLISDFPETVTPSGESSGGLNDVGTSTRL